MKIQSNNFNTSKNIINLNLSILESHFFMVYSSTPFSISQYMMLNRVNYWIMNLKGCERQQSLPNLRYYDNICMERQRKTIKTQWVQSISTSRFQYTAISIGSFSAKCLTVLFIFKHLTLSWLTDTFLQDPNIFSKWYFYFHLLAFSFYRAFWWWYLQLPVASTPRNLNNRLIKTNLIKYM